jgi:hypothetical protein
MSQFVVITNCDLHETSPIMVTNIGNSGTQLPCVSKVEFSQARRRWSDQQSPVLKPPFVQLPIVMNGGKYGRIDETGVRSAGEAASIP